MMKIVKIEAYQVSLIGWILMIIIVDDQHHFLIPTLTIFIIIKAIIVILQADLPLVDGDYCWADGKSVSTYDRSPNQHDLRILSPCLKDFDLYDFMVRIVMTFMVTIAGLMTILSSNTTGFEMIHLRIFFPCFCDHDEYYG